MDRYFYSIEDCGSEKEVHVSGNVYFNDVDEAETDHRIAEWTGFCLSLKQVKELISNEAYHYIELQHKKPLLDTIWQLAGAIREQRYIEIEYVKMSREKVARIIRPAGIMFSEFYFYLVGFLDDKEVREKFDNPEDPSPTIYRIDRMESVKVLNRKFQILYKDRFEEGEFRKRIQFMYGGKLKKVKFEYSPICPAVWTLIAHGSGNENLYRGTKCKLTTIPSLVSH